MKSRWLYLLITIFIIFSYMQFEYVRYCMECDAGYQEYSYANAVINIVGDRYLILLVSGILIVWSIAGLLAVTRNDFYLKLRIDVCRALKDRNELYGVLTRNSAIAYWK